MADNSIVETDKVDKEKIVNGLCRSICDKTCEYATQVNSARTLSYKERKQIIQKANMEAAVYRKRKTGNTDASLLDSLLFS